MNFFKRILLTPVLFACLLPNASYATPSISLTVSAPPGSASNAFGKSILKSIQKTPQSMLYTPCLALGATKTFGSSPIHGGTPVVVKGTLVNKTFDSFSISVAGTNDLAPAATGGALYDLYVFIVYTGAQVATPQTQFYVLKKGTAAVGSQVTLRTDVNSLTATTDAYIPKQFFSTNNIGTLIPGSTTLYQETIMGGDLWFDTYNLPQGTWLAVAILGDASIDFKDASTFVVWDAVPFVLGNPWPTTTGPSGTGLCN